MAFPPEFLDDIRARVALAGAVGRRVKLAKRGREHVGLCPFHSEKTPSFTVSEDKGFYHCFGCGAHGDVIGFVMRAEGLSFPEAVERLAGEAGLQVPRASPEERATARRRADLYEVVEAAAAWFEERLAGPEGAAARAYLTQRGLTAETVADFRLGYAPDKRGQIRSALNARGIDDGRLAEAGLIKLAEAEADPPRDYFFNRIVFPITDRRGRAIAFGGRALGQSRAKYLNSPETPLFHKGRVLYNLARARQAAHDTGELVVCEGYMDVIALGQAGFPATVAPLGTALTEEQIAELWRLADEPLLCFDGDEAGRRAAFRAAERALALLRPGRSLRFAVLPAGEDPDSLVRGQGAAALRAVLEAARPLWELLWLVETEGRRFQTPERQAGLVSALDRRIRGIPDAAVQAAYREALGRRFEAAFGYGAWGRTAGSGPFGGSRGGGSRGGPHGWARRWPRQRGGFRGAGRAGAPAETAVSDGLGARQAPGLLLRRQAQVLLAALVNHPELIAENAEELAGFTLFQGNLGNFSGLLVDLVAREPDLDTAGLKCHLSDQGYSGILGEILGPAVYVHGRFARPEGSLDEARNGVQDILKVYRRRQATSETEEAGRHLAEDMSEDKLARLEAKRRLIRESESGPDGLDHLD
ncbi:MAG: DNA primase [Proteobacteria bacterium]|nr:DNA primase [Pseudomonadota bacterium]